MKYLLVLALAAVARAQYLASPTVLSNGFLAETPEVQAARNLHFAEHARALGVAPAPIAAYHTTAYNGPLAVRTVLPNGFIADTPEVEAARNLHLAEHARALGVAPAPLALQAPVSSAYYRSSYSGPLAVPTVLPNGFLADTPEVAAVKNAHLAEYNRQLSTGYAF